MPVTVVFVAADIPVRSILLLSGHDVLMALCHLNSMYLNMNRTASRAGMGQVHTAVAEWTARFDRSSPADLQATSFGPNRRDESDNPRTNICLFHQ